MALVIDSREDVLQRAADLLGVFSPSTRHRERYDSVSLSARNRIATTAATRRIYAIVWHALPALLRTPISHCCVGLGSNSFRVNFVLSQSGNGWR
jgi:hypothetical protein